MTLPDRTQYYYVRNTASNRYLRATLDGAVYTGRKIADSFHAWHFYPHGSGLQIRNVASLRMLTLGSYSDDEGGYYQLKMGGLEHGDEPWKVASVGGQDAITIEFPRASLSLLEYGGAKPYAVTRKFEGGKELDRTHWVLERATVN
ncbi:hypothetical protein CPB83DRAFT_846262 [Crepidotus variabilis]|uniref:Uncharacterized protein n=1 Tax=Crepidotus variabilis TaxID=179855 RepID=A0A9P6JUD1_9AGAR|nr:hypothetical protein CPB83DRAFT_846262 [Crepidotus variabilis]